MNVSLSLRTLTNQAILQDMLQKQAAYRNITPGMMKNMYKIYQNQQDDMSFSEEARKKLKSAIEAQAKERAGGKQTAQIVKKETEDIKSDKSDGHEGEYEISDAEWMRNAANLMRPADWHRPASIEEEFEHTADRITALLGFKGLQLKEGEEIVISVEKNRFAVSGLADQEKQSKIEAALNHGSLIFTNKNVYGIGTLEFESLYRYTSDYTKSAETYAEAYRRNSLISLKNDVGDMRERTGGIAVDWSKLSKDENGKVHGLPSSLEWALDLYHDDLEPRSMLNFMAIGIGRPIHALLDAGYDNIPHMDARNIKKQFSYSADGSLKVL